MAILKLWLRITPPYTVFTLPMVITLGHQLWGLHADLVDIRLYIRLPAIWTVLTVQVKAMYH
jgi:hypothetical protein